MKLGILKELDTEQRVSLLPEAVRSLTAKHITVLVESNAGIKALADDEAYHQAGAVVESRNVLLQEADILLTIQGLCPADLTQIADLRNTVPEEKSRRRMLIGMYQPLYNKPSMEVYAHAGLTVFSLDMLPRITRAQPMDVLSSQASIAGYKAVLIAANLYGRYFPMYITAAGSIAPAKVLVLGAGVAGLQAIATARRLGAVVEVFDTRPVVRLEVQSLGARFVEVAGNADASQAGGYGVEQSAAYQQAQEELIATHIAKSDIVITTAQIPGKKAPVLVTEAMLTSMRKGSVIVDLAAGTGGNTPFTPSNETINFKGITLVGASNLPSSLPVDASKLYGNNLVSFIDLLLKDGRLEMDFEDELIRKTCITVEGKIVYEQLL
ncbi:NAD(P) transhydrogenase subunit alpha [Niabella terrae]